MVKFAAMLMLDEGDIMRLVRAGEKDRDGAIGGVDFFGEGKVENLDKEPGDAINIGTVKQEMVKAAGAHAARIIGPNIGIAGRRRVWRQFHLSVELDAVAAWDSGPEAPTRA